jgi:hypothetical protein
MTVAVFQIRVDSDIVTSLIVHDREAKIGDVSRVFYTILCSGEVDGPYVDVIPDFAVIGEFDVSEVVASANECCLTEDLRPSIRARWLALRRVLFLNSVLHSVNSFLSWKCSERVYSLRH